MWQYGVTKLYIPLHYNKDDNMGVGVFHEIQRKKGRFEGKLFNFKG